MGNKVFAQYNLGRTPYGEKPPVPGGKLLLVLKSYLNPAGTAAFYFDDKEDSGNPNDPSTRLNFDIDHDVTEVTIKLTKSMDWYWSNIYSAITTKDQLQDLYFDLQYSDNGHDFVFYDSADKTKKYRYIRFLAYKNIGAERGHGNLHAFSLNINLIMRGERYLAITLDPDIRNPPPPPELNVEKFLESI